MSRPPTVAWRRSHLDFVARVLDGLAEGVEAIPAEDGVGSVYIRDDETGEDVFKMNARGARLLAYAMSAHRCGPACDRPYGICPMIAIAWLLEGSPEAGEDPSETTAQGMRGER